MQVSIIMPYYNAAAYIRETVEAILSKHMFLVMCKTSYNK